jgi:hypothetical protein
VGQWRAAVTENTRGHVSLTEQMDTTTPQGEFLFHVFDALAQFERSRGTDHCRPRDAEKLVVVAALDIGATKAAVCRTFDIRRNTLIDSPARIGWSARLKVEGGRSDASPATERNPDRRAVRSNYGSA